MLRMAKNGREWRERWAVLHSWNKNRGFIELPRIPTGDELRSMNILVPPDWEGLRVWSGQVSSQYDEQLGRYLEGGETQLFIDFKHPHNAVIFEYVRGLKTMPTRWSDVNFGTVDRASVMPMEEGETAPKTVPQGYTTRIPAIARNAVPDNAHQ